MTELASTAERQSECTRCPRSILACVHLDGGPVALYLSDNLEGAKNHTCNLSRLVTPYYVTTTSGGDPRPCGRDGCTCPMFWGKCSTPHPDLASAEAEFRRREAELLGETQ